MKNIHVIPTDKPSRLYLGDNGNFVFGMIQTSIQSRNEDFTNQNVYITSDEEIKEGDWFICLNTNNISNVVLGTEKHDNCKKIILTTDLELQKDNVQAIDDEFLEWFVKNPSCEFIEIMDDWNSPRIDAYEYRVIIPNLEMSIGERKPHSFCETPNEKCTMNYCDENGCQNRKRNLVPKEEPDYTALLKPVGTTERQNKNLYSEEEVRGLLIKFHNEFPDRWDIDNWFEQIKKK